MVRIQRWAFSRTARGCITWYSLSESQGSPCPFGAFVRRDTRHPLPPNRHNLMPTVGVLANIPFPVRLVPLNTSPMCNKHNGLTMVCSSLSTGQVHKVVGLRTISLRCGELRACSCTGSLTTEPQMSWKCLRTQWGFCKNLAKNRAHPWRASLIR